ncbi:MAG: MMPL family transporter, partial [Nitrospira sp.]
MIVSRWVPLLWTTAMVAGCWYLTETLSVRNDLEGLLPDGATEAQQVLLSQVRQGLSGRLILLAVEGAPAEELARLSRSLAEAIRANGTIGIVANGVDDDQETDRFLIERYRYLLSPAITTETFSVAALRTSLEQRLDDLRSPLGVLIRDLIPTDPTGETWRILQTWSGGNGPMRYRGVWMSPDRSRALLVVAIKGGGFDVDVQESIQTAIRALFDQVVKQSGIQARLHMSGPGVFAVEIQRAIESEAWQLSVIASVLVVGLLYVSYRSFRLVVLSLLPIVTGVVAGVLVVNQWFGFVHGITLGFGITLLGIVDDYPIHLFSHLSGHESAGSVMRTIWPTMRVGMLTTVIGFSALLLSGYQALAQLGILAIVGLVTGAFVTRWVIPACIGPRFIPLAVPRHVASRLDLLSTGQVLAVTVLILASAILIWSDTPMWEQDVTRLSPVPEEKKLFDQQLRRELGAPDVRDLLVVEGSTIEELLEKTEVVAERMEHLRTNDIIKGYDIVSRYVPSRRTQLERQRRLPERTVLERNLAEALNGLPFTPGLFSPFVEAVQRSRLQEPIGPEAFAGT